MTRRNGSRLPEQQQLELFPTRYLSIDEVAELMQVEKSFIYRRTCRGHQDPIPCYRLGGHLRFRFDEIQEWIESHRVPHDEPPAVDLAMRSSVAAAKVTRRGGRRVQRQTKTVKSRSR